MAPWRCAILLLWPCLAPAHPLAPSLLEIEESPPGQLSLSWKTPLVRAAGDRARPELPDNCAPSAEPRLEQTDSARILHWRGSCAAALGPGQSIAASGLANTSMLLRLRLADGQRFETVLTGDRPDFRIPHGARAEGALPRYLGLGLQHILGGWDHLAFVLGLLLLVAGWRRLVLTVTAFTLGHSVTLSLAALGWIGLPGSIVEAAIAFSILVLAVELTRGESARPSLLRRYPWAMAIAFGLLHGLGFSGVLSELLTQTPSKLVALFGFNVGVELGQLCIVLAAFPLLLRLQKSPVLMTRVFQGSAVGVVLMGTFWAADRSGVLAIVLSLKSVVN